MTSNKSLLRWLSTIELDGKPSVAVDDNAYYNLADGYICGRVLNKISPKHFPDTWLQGIQPVHPDGSWRLRVSNLKRILQKIYDYASDSRETQYRISGPIYNAEKISPDVFVIAQNFDPDQMNRLIQLILFCAINSEQREEYIKRILDLPYKADIKEAIEELLNKPPNEDKDVVGDDSALEVKASNSNTSQIFIGERSNSNENSNMVPQMKNLNVLSNDGSDQDIPNVRKKSNKIDQVGDNYSPRRSSFLDKSSTSVIESSSAKFEEELLLQQNKRLLKQLDDKSQELIDIEAERDDFKEKCELLKDELDKVTRDHDVAYKKAEQLQRLQDELDEFKQKIADYEKEIQNLEKKNHDLRGELRIYEDKNCTQMERIMGLEEENGQLTNGANQIQLYKKKLQEIQAKLSQETHRGEKLEDNLNALTEKYHLTKKENERLFEMTNQLRASNGATMTVESNENSTNLINRVEELQRLLFQREQELAESEGKYQKNIKKAKEVIKQLNQTNSQTMSGSLQQPCISSVSSFNSNSLDENSVLKQQLKEREDRLIELERESYEYKKVKEIHERLMITAFYGLTTPMQWKNAEKRLERTMTSMSTSNPNNSPSITNHMKHSH